MAKLIRAFIACGIALCAATAWSQAYPSRPIALIVPYPPGGLIDLVARIIQPKLQSELGGSIVVENRSGAGGNIGAEAVARAAPRRATCYLRPNLPMRAALPIALPLTM